MPPGAAPKGKQNTRDSARYKAAAAAEAAVKDSFLCLKKQGGYPAYEPTEVAIDSHSERSAQFRCAHFARGAVVGVLVGVRVTSRLARRHQQACSRRSVSPAASETFYAGRLLGNFESLLFRFIQTTSVLLKLSSLISVGP
jgi:hypothetical protein